MNKGIKNDHITVEEALLRLKEGNFRFINDMPVNKDLLHAVAETKDGQAPFAAILSCMDSRTSAELVFDQGVGDIFSIRIAGNVVTDGILGSLEYATAVAGSSLILVLGHTQCGAIKGACDRVKMGHLTSLLANIDPVLETVDKQFVGDKNSANDTYVVAVTEQNIQHSIEEILRRSSIIRELVAKGKVGIAPASYNVATGRVDFGELDKII